MTLMNEQVTIRKATVSDLDNIVHLEQLCFREDRFSRRQFRYLIVKSRADFLVVGEAGRITAYLVLLKRRNWKGMRIYSIAVSPSHRGKGLARLLLDEAEERARRNGNLFLFLEVSGNNPEAIRLYGRHGFNVFGERPAYYQDGSSALKMRKPLR